jgi:hypothetical protein
VASNVNILESLDDEQAIDVGDDSKPVANLGPAIVVGESPYTTSRGRNETVKFDREFSFPSETLVEDYLDDLFSHGRLIKMNHTHCKSY